MHVLHHGHEDELFGEEIDVVRPALDLAVGDLTSKDLKRRDAEAGLRGVRR